jgi:hypothetical protein
MKKPSIFVVLLTLQMPLLVMATELISIPQSSAAGAVNTFPELSSITPVKWRVDAQTQGAGTPNSLGLGIFWPIAIKDSSTLFFDAVVNANFSDFSGYSSIINTDVAGITASTSTRLGYRWFNQDGSWMFGANAGYDMRSLKSGGDDTKVFIDDQLTVRYQQVALGAEAISTTWGVNAYALLPIGDKEQRLNSAYNSGALTTYGADVGYRILPNLRASLGYYYQRNNLELVNGSGARTSITYNLTNDLAIGANVSRDQAFQTRFSISLQYSFGKFGAVSAQQVDMFEPLRNRDIRVHDDFRSTPDSKLLQEAQQSAQSEKGKPHDPVADALQRAKIEATINTGAVKTP